MSHAHEGIGGMLDQHESELNRMAGQDFKRRDKMTWAAWVRPKSDEASMINTMLQVSFHIILCFRAKEKIKIIKGQEPQDLGWRPIASDRIHFETAFTVILPPNSKGTPDLSVTGSELRSPFDSMIKPVQINETLGKQLADWAHGGTTAPTKQPTVPPAENRSEGNVGGQGGLFGRKPIASKVKGEAIQCPNFNGMLKPLRNCATCELGVSECPSYQAA